MSSRTGPTAEAFTVHSHYHATPEEALADWQAGVGTPAADGTAFAPADDPRLLEFVLPRGWACWHPAPRTPNSSPSTTAANASPK